MKGKRNLEKAIVLGLLLSTSVYGSVWASDVWDERNHRVDPDTGTLTFDSRLYIWLNPTYVDYNEYKNLKEYQKGDYEDNPVEINKIIINSNLTNGLTIYNSNVDLSYADIEVNVDGQEIPEHFNNTNGIELNGKDVGLTVKSYTAHITAVESDAVSITENSYADEDNISPYFKVNNDFKADVTQGSGIRVNASTLNTMSDKTSSVTVNGNTKITLDGGAVTTEKTLFAPGMQPSAKVTYNPAGVYAGNTAFNFNYNGGKGNIVLITDETVSSEIQQLIDTFGENIGSNTYKKEVYGKATVDLKGNYRQ